MRYGFVCILRDVPADLLFIFSGCLHLGVEVNRDYKAFGDDFLRLFTCFNNGLID